MRQLPISLFLFSISVAADLYLADATAGGGRGTAIWSTHKPDGFAFAAKGGPNPFTYQAGVGGVIVSWRLKRERAKSEERARESERKIETHSNIVCTRLRIYRRFDAPPRARYRRAGTTASPQCRRASARSSRFRGSTRVSLRYPYRKRNETHETGARTRPSLRSSPRALGTDGAAGHPGFNIPPRAPLVFEIEVLKVE